MAVNSKGDAMAESRRSGLQHLLLEGLVIVLSVLVALLVEDWRSERQARADVTEALAVLDVEVRANLEELESFLGVVTGRYERLVALAPTVDDARPFSEYSFGGYPTPDLDVSAWARLRSDPVANRIAPGRLREAFLLYDHLSYFEKLADQIFQLVFGPIFEDPNDAEVSYRISENILSQQLDYAEFMISEHRGFLAAEP